LDLTLALTALSLSWPLLLMLAICIGIMDGPPVFFRQTRIARHGKSFRLWKFRTMVVALSDGPALTVDNDPRVTPLGRILRRFKLDELPQLINIVAGDMAFVGPRPEVPRFVEPSDPAWQEILRVRPGLTDPASLLYFDEQSSLSRHDDPEAYYRQVLLPSKLATSLEYLKRRTLFSDTRLLLYTVFRCFAGRRISNRRLERAPLKAKTG
jgi:lipopolysaccharide/colanic/teichoic acid biosynthesis glycosyltransferase